VEIGVENAMQNASCVSSLYLPLNWCRGADLAFSCIILPPPGGHIKLWPCCDTNFSSMSKPAIYRLRTRWGLGPVKEKKVWFALFTSQYLPYMSSLAVQETIPASFFADKVYQPASAFLAGWIRRQAYPVVSWCMLGKQVFWN